MRADASGETIKKAQRRILLCSSGNGTGRLSGTDKNAAGHLTHTILTDYVSSGTLPAALFILVMSASSFPKDSRIFRCMMSLRGEMAILASVFCLTHVANCGQSMRKIAGSGLADPGMIRIMMGSAVLHGNSILLCKKLQEAA